MINSLYPWFKLDSLNGFMVLGILLFFTLTMVYSSVFMKGRLHLLQYYTYIILTAVAAIAAVLSNNLLLLLGFWGFLGLTLYLLISMGDKDSERIAKKTFIIVGGTDALMLLGIGIIYYLTKTMDMDKIRIPLNSNHYILPTVAYLSIAIASFAKAGLMPFHSWIPDTAQSAPLPVVAYLPASLDKLLGIYLLARISLRLFIMNNGANIFLMIMGAFTILAGVMMALTQHNMKRLLGYHAVSQVGYMVLGIGTGNPIGIAGGLFHMLNHAVYKSCLFFVSGNVEYRTKTTDLDELGGLAKVMPLTYICAIIASLAISGIPPFNGFVSKWMIYQGLIEELRSANFFLRGIITLCLASAMFGSALTLASFMKLIHATFLGQRLNDTEKKHPSEASWQMWFPPFLLASICVVFGIFAVQIPLKYFIFPALDGASFIGTWVAGLSTLLIIVGLAFGLIILKFSWFKPKLREDKVFTGGESVNLEPHAVTGTGFYNTIKEFGFLNRIYKEAAKGTFDIYEQGKNLVFGIGKAFQYLHNGVLPTYLVWTLLGMIVLFLALSSKFAQ